ncbi:hypothetical protein PV11_05397 [Exophiala sideris]|uniref:DUF6603 domain-containing protein n=1 Tax=Exophiala sideris TaxID=1016849 RepID=A0A0D1W3K6_9EURO|nr:hypothetical protein PV11_05397 [Exophiala sideris]
MAPVPIEVHSYHINVGAGDCAVHLLVKKQSGNGRPVNPNKRGNILSAVLIDGGKSGVVDLQVLPVFEHIEQTYLFEDGQTTLRFDAIIITHWDNDHYGGVLGMIWDDLAEKLPLSAATQCRYMKYNGADATTRLYTPYWDRGDSTLAVSLKSGKQHKVDTAANLNLRNNQYYFGMTIDSQNAPFLCLLNYGAPNVIGVNFFDGSTMKLGADWTKITTVSILVDPSNRTPPLWKSAPGLYGISCDGQVVGWVRPAKLSVGKPHHVGLIPTSHSASNQSSIGALVIWHDGTVSHYTAGDAEEDTETPIIQFIQRSNARLLAMKLSHHGAVYSTPVDMISTLDPDHIICSAGTQYYHPRWEFPLLVDIWQRWLNKNLPRGQAVQKVFLPLGYPYWMVQNASGSYIAEVNTTSTFSNPDAQAFRSQIAPWLDALKDRFLRDAASAEKDYLSKPIQDWVRSHWSAISWVGPENTLFPGMTAINNGRGATADDTIRYHLLVFQLDLDESTQKVYPYTCAQGRAPPVILSPQTASTTHLAHLEGKPGKSPTTKVFSTLGPSRIVGAARGIDKAPRNPEAKTYADTSVETELGPAGAIDYVSVLRRAGDGKDQPPAFSSSPEIASTRQEYGSRPVLDESDSDYYFISSATPAIFGADKFYRLASSSALDKFFQLLRYQTLALVTKPSSLTVASAVALANSDEWGYWMRLNGLQVASVQLLATPTQINGFSANVAISPSITGKAGVHPYPWNITFSTNASSITSNFPNIRTNINELFESGVAKNLPMLLLALDPQSLDTSPFNLDDIVNIFGLPYGEGGLFGLGADLLMQIDTDQSDAGPRNAIWFAPGSNYPTTLRLQFTLTSSSKASVQSILDQVFGKDNSGASKLVLDKAAIIGRRTSEYMYMGEGNANSDWQFGISSNREMIMGATFSGSSFGFSGFLEFKESSVEFTFQPTTKVEIGDIIDFANSLVENVCKIPLPGDRMVGDAAQFLDKNIPIYLREISVTIVDQNGLKLSYVRVLLEMPMRVGRDPANPENVVFFITYTWPSDIFEASLYTSIANSWLTPLEWTLMPDYEPFRNPVPLTNNLVKSLSLSHLIPDDDGLHSATHPEGIPDILEGVSLTISPGRISFYGQIGCTKPTTNTVPAIYVEELTLKASYTFGSKTKSVIQISLHGEVVLTPRQPVKPIVFENATYDIPDALLEVSVDYDSALGWSVSGNVQDLSLACLYSYAEPGYDGPMMDLLERIMVKQLDVTYKHNSSGSANCFTFSGVIYVGQLELDFDYTYDSSKDPLWTFTASLSENPEVRGDTTLLGVLASVIGWEAISFIPSCVDIPIHLDQSRGTKAVQLEVAKSSAKDSLLFSLRFSLPNGAAVTFVQIQSKSASTTSPKRVVRFSVAGLPTAKGIPLVGEIPQPFDEMDYLWVHDDGPAGGLLRDEVNLINKEVLTGPGEQLRFKDLYQTDDPQRKPPNNLIFAAGSHFVLVADNKIVLDYVFGQPKSNSSELALLHDSGSNNDTGVEGQATLAPLKKSIGPLSISNIGMRYQDSTLWLLLDATFVLGPIGFTLKGFGIGFDVSSINLHDWKSLVPTFTLSGLGVEFDQPPVEIAGLFVEQNGIYMGGLTVGFDPYTLTAIGAYGHVPDHNDLETVFLYGQLDGPLIQLEIIEISGVKLGFGLNSKVTFPDVSTIQFFPFTADEDAVATASKDPLKLMDSFCTPRTVNGQQVQWIAPRADSYWLAIGLDAVAFDVVNVSAIVIVEFNPYVTLGVFAHGVAAIPESASSPDDAFAWVEFGIVATVDFKAGTFCVEGILLPNSFVLSPSCHLTGGYAACSWFGDNPYAGQFVYSIGGYHTRFQRPLYYPNPPRLGIYWSLGGDITITGEAYFAVTAKACMGGGVLHALFSCGALSAHFDAWADFLIVYNPFYFQGDIGVDVGVSFTLDLWICTIHINVDIGASLFLEGPPFRGVVHVDFWVFGFDIHFGDGDNNTDPLDFAHFLLLLQQVDQQNASASGTSGPDSVLLYNVQTGGVPSKGQIASKQITKWYVRAGTFTFRVQTRFACTKASCNNESAVLNGSDLTNDSVYSTPMHVSDPITSELTVTITPNTSSNPWRLTPVMKDVPKALWGPYSEKTDPTRSDADDLLDLTGPTSKLMLGVVLQVPKPSKSNDLIPMFNAINAMKADINDGRDPTLPVTPPLQTSWLPLAPSPGQVEHAWDAAAGQAQPLVDAWVKGFGWDLGKVPLTGSPPPTLLAGFDNYYMEDPRIAGSL